MGNCDFTKFLKEVNHGGTMNKNLFQQEYILGKGGYGKVKLIIFHLGMESIK